MTTTWKKLAFLDEVATLSTNTPHAVDGTTAAAGSGSAASKDDHVHALGPLVAALDVNKQQLTSAVLQNAANDPGTPVIGQVYFKTGDLHPYICTVA